MIDATDATFEGDVLTSGLPVVVEFTAPWWAPAYAPVLWLGLRRVRSLARARRGRAAPPGPPAGDGTTD